MISITPGQDIAACLAICLFIVAGERTVRRASDNLVPINLGIARSAP